MTDSVLEAAPATANENRTKLQGSHIWYELMTTDPEGAKRFYEEVVPGLNIGDRLPGDQDYRMFGRSDGGSQWQFRLGHVRRVPAVATPQQGHAVRCTADFLAAEACR